MDTNNCQACPPYCSNGNTYKLVNLYKGLLLWHPFVYMFNWLLPGLSMISYMYIVVPCTLHALKME